MNSVKYRRMLATGSGTPDTNREPSNAIWGRFGIEELLSSPSRGYFFEDKFDRTPLLATPTITTQAIYNNGWKAFGSSGGTVLSAFLEGGGGIVLTETDDNEGIGLATVATPFQIDRGKGNFAWEIRLKTNSVADNDHGIFVGLADPLTLSATVPITAAGAIADENVVGFHRLEADGDQWDTVYKADGVTQVTVQTDAIPTGITLAADTFIKLGMLYENLGPSNGSASASEYILSFWINGVKCTSTKQIPAADGTDFPNDVDMGLVIAMLCASNNDAIVTVDWVRAAQYFVQ